MVFFYYPLSTTEGAISRYNMFKYVLQSQKRKKMFVNFAHVANVRIIDFIYTYFVDLSVKVCFSRAKDRRTNCLKTEVSLPKAGATWTEKISFLVAYKHCQRSIYKIFPLLILRRNKLLNNKSS